MYRSFLTQIFSIGSQIPSSLIGETSPYTVTFWEASKSTPTFRIVQIHCHQGTYADVDGEGTHPMPCDRPRQRGQWGKKKNQAQRNGRRSATNFFAIFSLSYFLEELTDAGSLSLSLSRSAIDCCEDCAFWDFLFLSSSLLSLTLSFSSSLSSSPARLSISLSLSLSLSRREFPSRGEISFSLISLFFGNYFLLFPLTSKA